MLRFLTNSYSTKEYETVKSASVPGKKLTFQSFLATNTTSTLKMLAK